MIKYKIAIALYSLKKKRILKAGIILSLILAALSSKKKRILKAGIILLIILAAVSSIFLYTKYKKAQDALKSPSAQSAANNETQTILEKVGKLVELPSETPTVATVTDVNKLKGQPFFAKAQNGDKVLVYTKAQKAIIYRPSINKIIEIAAINTGPNPSPNEEAPTNAPPTSIPTPKPTQSVSATPTPR